MSDTPSPMSSPLFLPLREQSLLRHLTDGTPPDTPLEQGLKSLVDWLQAWEFGRGQPG